MKFYSLDILLSQFWNQSVVPCPFLTVGFLICVQVSQETGDAVWYSYLFKNFSQFIVLHIVKGFRVVWFIGGEVTGWCSRDLVLSLKFPSST